MPNPRAFWRASGLVPEVRSRTTGIRLAARAATKPAILLEFHHGFGDAAQLTVVLRHLRKHYPDWAVDLVCKVGAHTLFGGLVRNVFPFGGPAQFNRSSNGRDYTHRRWLRWPEVFETFIDSPATKAEYCLRHVFGITPEPALCRYHVEYGEPEAARARAYLEQITAGMNRREQRGQSTRLPLRPPVKYPVVLFHYQGNTAKRRKNVDEQIIRRLTGVVRARGLVPVVLDWHTPHRSKLIDQTTVFCPDVHDPLWRGTGTGDGAGLAALIDHCSLFVGIDSGPQKVAGATGTPSIGVWTQHHPLHFYGLSNNVLHVVTKNHERFIHGDVGRGLDYFTKHYRHRVIDKHLRYSLPELIDETLDEVVPC